MIFAISFDENKIKDGPELSWSTEIVQEEEAIYEVDYEEDEE
jgi:hypothetical protein